MMHEQTSSRFVYQQGHSWETPCFFRGVTQKRLPQQEWPKDPIHNLWHSKKRGLFVGLESIRTFNAVIIRVDQERLNSLGDEVTVWPDITCRSPPDERCDQTDDKTYYNLTYTHSISPLAAFYIYVMLWYHYAFDVTFMLVSC